MVERLGAAVHHLREDPPENAEDVVSVLVDDVVDGPDQEPESVPVADLPIDGYDDLAARQVVDRLAALDRADLARIEMYEREHRNRSTVLGKITMLTA